MSRDALGLALLVAICGNVALLVAWFHARRRVLELERTRDLDTSDDRTARLETAVEELSGRVDQINRGQEFLNRYVFERRHRSSKRLPEGEAQVTPH